MSSELLLPLDDDQQRLVDLVAEAFTTSGYEWPFFDFVEGVLDSEGRDAWAILDSFPEVGRWRYGAVSWSRSGGAKPSAGSEVCLSVAGLWHAPAAREYVDVFFALIGCFAEARLAARPEPRVVRELSVSSEEFAEYWRAGRHSNLSPRLTYQMAEHEPATRAGGGNYQPATGSWTRGVARELLEFHGVTDISDYVARLEASLSEPAISLQPVLSSPLSLAASLDYLDVVWRLTHDRKPLFQLASAERVTRLAFDLQTPDEFGAHLSALAEILNSANDHAQAEPPRKQRDRALARVEADLIAIVGGDASSRVGGAIAVLESIIALRDAGQHGAASDRAVAAHARLGVSYPPTDWHEAWRIISARTVNALNVLREELALVAL